MTQRGQTVNSNLHFLGSLDQLAWQGPTINTLKQSIQNCSLVNAE